jgi:uncharacterized protein (UPF0179 family)
MNIFKKRAVKKEMVCLKTGDFFAYTEQGRKYKVTSIRGKQLNCISKGKASTIISTKDMKGFVYYFERN